MKKEHETTLAPSADTTFDDEKLFLTSYPQKFYDLCSVGAIIKPIPNYPGYFASSCGRIISTKRGCCLIKPYLSSNGYLTVKLSEKNVQGQFSVHRLIAKVHLDPPDEDKPLVCHKNGDRFDNNSGNLYYGSTFDNADDMVRHGRTLKNRKVPRKNLTGREVREIHGLLGTISQKRIAQEYGVGPIAINRIACGKTHLGVGLDAV